MINRKKIKSKVRRKVGKDAWKDFKIEELVDFILDEAEREIN